MYIQLQWKSQSLAIDHSSNVVIENHLTVEFGDKKIYTGQCRNVFKNRASIINVIFKENHWQLKTISTFETFFF